MDHSTQILADAAEALAYVRVLWLPDTDWDRFETVVHDMQRALDADDLPLLRRSASMLTGLGQERPLPGDDLRSTGEPRRTRFASDKLAKGIQARAGAIMATDPRANLARQGDRRSVGRHVR
jgi:hypothetical protein